MPKRKAITGWTAGHKVFFVETFDGVRMARRYGEYAEGMTLASATTDSYGRILVRLGDGTEELVRKDLLRLTPPPGLTNKAEKSREAKPKPRKEAIDPQYGTETTIFDHLEA